MADTNKIYEAIEIAKATGKIKKGTNEVTKVIERGQAKLVVVAEDVTPPEVVMHLPLLAKDKGIPCHKVPSKERLGEVAGMDRPAAAIAVIQEGDAKNIIRQLMH